MTTRDEITTAIRDIDTRLAALRDRIIEGGDKPLLEGDWRVRDALSHLAARANGVDRVLQRLRAWEAGTPYMPCLLYTSPSPRDRTRSRMPSSA